MVPSKIQVVGDLRSCHDCTMVGDTYVRSTRVLFILAVKFPQDIGAALSLPPLPQPSNLFVKSNFQEKVFIRRHEYLLRDTSRVSILATSFYEQQASKRNVDTF